MRPSSLQWPTWQRPTNWTCWRRLLQYISTRGRLLQELGDWIAPTHQEWQWYFDASQDVVYHCPSTSQWTVYHPIVAARVTRRTTLQYASPQPCDPPSLASLLVLTTVVWHNNDYIQSLHSVTPLVASSHTSPSTLWSPHIVPPEFSDTPSFYQTLIGPTPPTAFQCAEVVDALRGGEELLGCTDGSFVEGNGNCYHGWVLASETRRTIVEGSGPGHGCPSLLSSYRAELGGLLALVYIVYRISTFHKVDSGKLRLHCDNRSALNKAVSPAPLGITPFLSSDYDLIDLVRLYFGLLPIITRGEWVKGHYSGKERAYKHDLNDQADFLATSANQSMPPAFRTKPVITPPPGY